MKNKIFLTSMLAVLVACPAFAEYGINQAGQDPDDSATWTSNTQGTITYGQGETSVNAPCGAPPLVSNGQSYTNGTFTFEAQWSPKQYNVTYDKGTCDGTGRTISNGLTYGEDYTVLGLGDASDYSGVTEPTGYSFQGWTESLTGGATRQPQYIYESWSTDGGLTLTANCTPNTYTVRYECGNGGIFTAAYSDGGSNYNDWSNAANHSQNVEYDAPYAAPAPAAVCTKTGATAPSSWTCYEDVENGQQVATVSTTSTIWNRTQNIVCKVEWEANVINLDWELNDGELPTGTSTPSTCWYGSLATDDHGIRNVPKPTRTGYNFTGWEIIRHTDD
jgi:hypothetical protein